MNCVFFRALLGFLEILEHFLQYNFLIYFMRLFFLPREKQNHCSVDKRNLMYYADSPQILLVCECALSCVKIQNFCWCASSHTIVRKKNLKLILKYAPTPLSFFLTVIVWKNVTILKNHWKLNFQTVIIMVS